jgi:uncharacterized protein
MKVTIIAMFIMQQPKYFMLMSCHGNDRDHCSRHVECKTLPAKSFAMKKAFIVAVTLVSFFQCFSQVPYNVVFDVTSKDTMTHKMVIRWLKEITDSRPDAKLEVVFYAQSLDMITNGNSVVANDVKMFAARPNVSFRVCEIAMKNNGVTKDQLISGVTTVPDGIYELVVKQKQGWGYIKAAR